MLTAAQNIQQQLTAWRRDFHRHPELGFQETRTAKAVAAALREMGLDIQTGIGKTGVVAHIGTGSPVVAIRADMDALPITEANDVPYASQNPGVMHACGHDAHTAMLLGVARLLAPQQANLPGEVRLLFQPCEETQDETGRSGASRMIDDGALENVDSILALHVASDVEAGKIWVQDGYASAASDSFQATITGEGGHGAYPHKGIDPVFIATQVLNTVYAIPSRRIDPTRPAVISIGAIHAGETTNVIPREVAIQGTIRSYDEATRSQLRAELVRALAVAEHYDGAYELSIEEGFPAMYNTPDIAALIRQVVVDLAGPDTLMDPLPGMGAEDFSYMLQQAPGAMFILGARLDDVNRPHHTPVFDIAESVLPLGAAVLAESALRLLTAGSPS